LIRLTLITILCIYSCTQVEDNPYNPLDPNTSDYKPPDTFIKSSHLNNTIIDTSAINIEVEGNNEYVTEFSYSLNSGEWANWSINNIIHLTFLDDGEYLFSVKGRYPSGEEDPIPAFIEFEINMIQGPGLRIYPMYSEYSISSDQANPIIEIYLDEVENVVGIELEIIYDPEIIIPQEITKGNFLLNYSNNIMPEPEINTELGTISISIALTQGENYPINGTGSLINVIFKSESVGETNVIITENSFIRGMNNIELNINEIGGGIIYLYD